MSSEKARKDALQAIERAMVRIRRSQTRRTIGLTMQKELGETFDLSHAMVVDALEEESLTVGEVGERLGIDPTRASRVVKSAVEAGYVRRAASQDDGRRILLELTASGRQLADKSRRARRSAFGRVIQSWPLEDAIEFARLLTKFTSG